MEKTYEEIVAIEKFKDNLKLCFIKFRDNAENQIVKETINYVVQVIDIHYSLAELDFERYTLNQNKEAQKVCP